MKLTIKIEGEIKTTTEKIAIEIDYPEDLILSFEHLTMLMGAIEIARRRVHELAS